MEVHFEDGVFTGYLFRRSCELPGGKPRDVTIGSQSTKNA